MINEAGLQGRGTFGYLRGWIKTAAVEIAVDDAQSSHATERRFRSFRLSIPYVVIATVGVAILVIA